MTEARESVRVRDWLALRAPAPPPALAALIADSVGEAECESASLPALLVEKALQLLKTIGSARDSADNLLAADALITYAMEAAIENCTDFESIAAKAANDVASSLK